MLHHPHLPAFVALERWAVDGRVVIVGEAAAAGCERLLAVGAREILVIGSGRPGPGVEVHPPASPLPLRDRCVDLVASLDAASGDEARLSELVEEAGRVLRPGGALALWAPPDRARAAEAAARVRFDAVAWVAAVPWSMIALAPAGGARRVLLSESLAPEPAAPIGYLLVATRGAAAPIEECVLLPGAAAIEEAAAPRLEAGRVEAEPGEAARAGADIARDRDRLRDELARRTADLAAVEARLWQSEEAAQKERIENVRLVAEVDRLREQVERSRLVEQERARELEARGHELRRLELANAELQGLAGRAGDPGEGAAIGAHEAALLEVVRRRERELSDAQEAIAQLRRSVDEYAGAAGNLRGELVVLQVEVEQLRAAVPALQRQLGELRGRLRERDEEAAALQARLEASSAEHHHLRERLRERLREAEALVTERQALESAVVALKAELALGRQALAAEAESGDDGDPAAARRSARAQQARGFAAELERLEARQQELLAALRRRAERAELEASVRADEQEHLLHRLDSSEQRIWEMNDAADRNAARVAASLAQYAKLREQLEDLVHELEVTRSLLAESEARAVELERGLASERARLVRLGGGGEAGAGEAGAIEGERGAAAIVEVWTPREAPPGAGAGAGVGAGAGFELDSELLRMTDAILDGGGFDEPPFAGAALDGGAAASDLDREMTALLDAADELAEAAPLAPAAEVEDELIAEVEQVMAEARASAAIAAADAAAGEAGAAEVLADSGIIIEMLDDDEAWPEEASFGVSPPERAPSEATAPPPGHFVDLDLDDDGPVEGAKRAPTIGIPVDDDDA